MTGGRLRQLHRTDDSLLVQLENDTAQLEAGQRALRAFLEARGTSVRALHHSELVFEELVTNIIRHAYGDRDRGTLSIDVEADIRCDEIILTVEDTGPPFDPSQASEPPRATDIESANIGGLGLKLVRMAAKRIEYERAGDRNRVRVEISRA